MTAPIFDRVCVLTLLCPHTQTDDSHLLGQKGLRSFQNVCKTTRSISRGCIFKLPSLAKRLGEAPALTPSHPAPHTLLVPQAPHSSPRESAEGWEESFGFSLPT